MSIHCEKPEETLTTMHSVCEDEEHTGTEGRQTKLHIIIHYNSVGDNDANRTLVGLQ